MNPDDTAPLLGFTPAWLASGLVTPADVADFARLAAANPGRPARWWRWAAFRDYVEGRERLTAEECRAAYRVGEAEADVNLGTAMMCSVLYRRACPVDVLRDATASDRAAVRRTAARLGPAGEPSRHG